MSIDGAKLKENFDLKWGRFRKFIAAHPLTGFWIGVGCGASAGYLVAQVI